MKAQVLLFVDDDPHAAWSFGSDLLAHAKAQNLVLQVFTDAERALAFIQQDQSVDIWGAIVDLWMIDKATGQENTEKGREIIDAIRLRGGPARIAVLSAHIDDRAKADFQSLSVIPFKKPTSSLEIFEALLKTLP